MIAELKADCEAYADALAALQRARDAERNAHGAQVRRQQAELDALESELALFKAQSCASETALTALCKEGTDVLMSPRHQGDDPVAAEWRRLVATERAKLTPTAEQPPSRDRHHHHHHHHHQRQRSAPLVVDQTPDCRQESAVEGELAVLDAHLGQPGLDVGMEAKLRARKAALEETVHRHRRRRKTAS